MEYKLGVVGSPIEHSLSPEIHNIFAQELNIKISYEKYLVNAGELSSFCNQFFDNPNALGLNVTLPLKKEVLELDANKSSIVNKIHSANTIKKSNESLYLHSTDGQGLVNDLSKKGILIKDKKVLILGAGGSAASIIPASKVSTVRSRATTASKNDISSPSLRVQASANQSFVRSVSEE